MSEPTLFDQAPALKRCRGCGSSKPTSEFNKHPRCADGINPRCRACEKVYKRRHYRANHAQVRAKHAEWYAAHREQVNAARRKGKPAKMSAEERRRRQMTSNERWAKKNPAKVNAIKRNWESRNPAKSQAAKKAWKVNNSAAVLAHTKARQAIKRGRRVVPLSAADRVARIRMYGDRCTYCRKICRYDVPRHHPDHATEDHLIPLSRGGYDCGSNLRLACHACNLAKGMKTASEFLAIRNASKPFPAVHPTLAV